MRHGLWLVFRWLLDLVDDEHFNRSPVRIQSQAELLLNSRKKISIWSGWTTKLNSAGSYGSGRVPAMAPISRIVLFGKPGFIDHGSVEYALLMNGEANCAIVALRAGS